MRRRRFLATAGAGATSGLTGCLGVLDRQDGSADGPPRLTVDGRWLTDPDGNRIVLRGVNVVDPWWGTTFAEDVRNKDYWETLRLATDEDAGWHTHVLRVPIEPRTVREVGLDAVVEDYLDRVVEIAAEEGVYVLIDYHTIERYDTDGVDRRIREFWNAVAPAYAEESHVLFELFNEPTQPFGNGLETWNNWRDHAQPWVDLIRGHAPENPIVVGSPRWTAMTNYAAQAPFEGENLLYSAHIFPSWSREIWEPTFGAPALDVPVFVTEWGYVNVETDRSEPHMIGSTEGWGKPFREWLRSHPNVNWCAWNFDSHWMPRMFDKEWNLLGGGDYMGEFTKDWLHETRTDFWPPGRSEQDTAGQDNRPPATPADLRTIDRGLTSVTVSWEPATDADGDDIVQYRVAVDGDRERVLRGATQSVALTDLDPGTAYEVTVAAVDERGTASSEPATLTVSTVETPDPLATVPRTSSVPTVDGTVDDAWSGVERHAVENVLISGPTDDDLTASWRAAWDESALYYLISVTDDGAFADSEEVYQDDNVEVYLDPDNSRESAYDGENDAQFIVRRGEDTIHPGANSVGSLDGMRVSQTETDDGYRVELAIPWEGTGVTPEPGHLLGTDVQVTDDVDGGDRDAKLAWFGTEDNAWESPQNFGVVELGE